MAQRSQCPGERLREAISGRGDSKKLALELGVDPSLVTRWTTGERKPNTRQRVYICKKFGIQILDWDIEPMEAKQ